ncbi:uncharacterized protein LOC119908717 isoform X2 [Micropterus salmoides]|uniref:uncharacterized protein LOC119908717 isoform X2 n=1 Tax=Micropterus salmoides TaxID=27706 RepID=UPI0018EE1CAA|nr:uncharacterized protein LOC119908717 isoform X2 [Micropterus salmoides]
MSLLEIILIFVLQFEGIYGEPTFYKIAGHDVILPCATASSSDTTCSSVSWLYSRDLSETFSEVANGKVLQTSPQAARRDLDKRCSLVIYNITAEDAGLYTCRHGTHSDHDSFVHLSVLTISPSPPDADPKRDGNITLECSLLRYSDLPPCEQNSIRWMDETGTVLLGEGVGYKLLGQKNCVSFLSVKRQSGHNRRYTCQFVKENNVEIEADYTPVFTDPSPDQPYIIIGAVVGMVVVLVIIAAVFIKYRKRVKEAKVTEDVQKPIQQPDELESNLTYVTVSHNQQASLEKKVEVEEVTYSAIRLQ